MSDKGKIKYKPFSVKHLLQKDEESEKHKKNGERFERDDVKREREGKRCATQAPIYGNSKASKDDCNNQALNLAERLAGNI